LIINFRIKLLEGKSFNYSREYLASMMRSIVYLSSCILVLGIIGAVSAEDNATQTNGTKVLMKTTMGDITIQLYDDMPITAGNFEKLVKEGFYDGIIFHRVIDGFMIQGGDPEGTGMGGPGYSIKDEFTDHNRNDRGTVAMANAGPNTGGSQFFINLVDNEELNDGYPVFGKVIEGMDVVDKIAKVKTDSNDKPLTEVKITEAKVIS
jgi:peptidylprolyl isomerase